MDILGESYPPDMVTGFTDANLTRVNFSSMNLTGFYFTRTNLEEADLSGCTLVGADFTETRLE